MSRFDPHSDDPAAEAERGPSACQGAVRRGEAAGFGPAHGVAAQLRAHGIRPTAQRVHIASVVLARNQHLSADEVLARVNAIDPVVSKATVYNTLGLFSRHGLVRELIVDRAKVFYDSNTSEHYHVYDIDSGNLADVPCEAISVLGMPELPPGTELDGLDVIVRVRARRT